MQKTLVGLCLGLLLLNGCEKDSPTGNDPKTVLFPTQSVVTYGEELLIPLPDGYADNGTVTVKFTADQTEDYHFSDGTTLRQKLIGAARYDAAQQAILVDSRLLYPNAASSVLSDQVLPEEYVLTVNLSIPSQQVTGLGHVHFTVTPATFTIKGAQLGGGIAFAYGLRGSEETSFKLSAAEAIMEGAEWYLPPNEFAQVRDGKIVFAPQASGGESDEETVFNLQPALVKDGFVVSSVPFRMIFIREIEFFFGQYYPDLDIKIDLSLRHIGLGNGYLSDPPVLYPDKYKSTFRLKFVEKDGIVFDNTAEIFEVEESTGRVRVKASESLTVGMYKITLEAITTTGMVLETALTLGMGT